MLRAMVIAVCVVLGWTAASGAATAIFYSDADEYFGWAAGYSSYHDAEGEAQRQCRSGGRDCRLAVECDGGWSAIAFADDTAKGVGAACGWKTAYGARINALALCMHASRAMCWTSAAFDGRGNQLSASDNDSFDMTWFAQTMLGVLGFTAVEQGVADGVMGPKTRAAIRAFETRLGLRADGGLADFTLWRLLNAIGGPTEFGLELYGAIVEPYLDSDAGYIFAMSSQPAPDLSYSRQLVGYDDEEQRLGLATMLTFWDAPCRLPANTAKPLPADGSGGWQVGCAQGDYTAIFDETSHLVVPGLQPINVKDGKVTIGGPSNGPVDNGPADGPSINDMIRNNPDIRPTAGLGAMPAADAGLNSGADSPISAPRSGSSGRNSHAEPAR